MRKSVWALLALAAAPLQAQDVERWELTSASVGIRLNVGLVRDLGLRVSPLAPADKDGYGSWSIGTRGSMTAVAPGSIYKTVESGELTFTTGPSLTWKGDAVALRGATLRPGLDSTFVVTTADGSPLFTADHTHFKVDRAARTIRLYNMDLRLTPELAERMREPRHAGLAVGVLELNVSASIPKDSVEVPDGACVTPNWGNPHGDVGLIGLTYGQVARGGTPVVVAAAPSSVLKNVGSTDVPWIVKFSQPGPGNFQLAPYGIDQHPFLVWNLYRVSNGVLQQIGVSGLKHAFTTVNTNCGCAGGATLWVSCEDTYGVGTNNSTDSLGPRSELNPRTGIWRRCGSIFDTNCDGTANGVPGFTGPADNRRMVVLETDLQTPGATYYFDSWYVVRDDVNIFNTMGYRQVSLSFNGSTWSFNPVTSLTLGATVDAWVNPAAPGPNADNERIVHADGNLTLAVRATDLGGGQWRYNYALMNHDFNRNISSFSVPLPSSAVVSNVTFADVDRDPATDWVGTATPGTSMKWSLPAPVPGQKKSPQLKWGTLYSFGFEANVAPSAVGAMTAHLGIWERGGELTVGIMGPSAP
jgi:hypothetical protein